MHEVGAASRGDRERAGAGRPVWLLWLVALVMSAPAAGQAVRSYVPTAGEWERRRPEQVGMDGSKLQEAIAFAQANESRSARDLEEAHYQSFGREPFGDAVGPFKVRGPQSGIIVRNGYIVAEWGDVERVDMTFSVTKSFVSTVVGLAYDRKLIRNVNDLVYAYMAPVLPASPSMRDAERSVGPFGAPRPIDAFATEHNRKITWDHLLRQVSDWEGTLWGKPEWADRPSGEAATWWTRERKAPGSAYEYNDTRVNVLALAALNVWRRPLPDVLREYVMDPIGASPTWRWYGYDTSWIILDGKLVQSVSGGGHFGGGMFISARDQARFGLLTLRNGRWGDRQILSEEWLRMARTPTGAQQTYGFMNFFLNTNKARLASAPASAWSHLGNGANIIYCDPEHDLVIVARWLQSSAEDGLVQRVIASIQTRTSSGGS